MKRFPYREIKEKGTFFQDNPIQRAVSWTIDKNTTPKNYGL